MTTPWQDKGCVARFHLEFAGEGQATGLANLQPCVLPRQMDLAPSLGRTPVSLGASQI